MAAHHHVPLCAFLVYVMWETISNKCRSKISILLYVSARVTKTYCISSISLDSRRMSISEVGRGLRRDVHEDRQNWQLARDIRNKSTDTPPNFPNPSLA